MFIHPERFKKLALPQQLTMLDEFGTFIYSRIENNNELIKTYEFWDYWVDVSYNANKQIVKVKALIEVEDFYFINLKYLLTEGGSI